MAQKEEKPPGEDHSAPEPSDPEVRATIEATQKAIEKSAAEIERSKRLLRETEELGGIDPATTQPPDSTKGSVVPGT
jgi:hypothetical protein